MLVIKMIKYSEAIGLPVITAADASRVGNVKDIVFCPKNKEVIGYIIEKRNFETKTWFVNSDEVFSLGHDALIIEAATSLKGYRKSQLKAKLKDKGDIIGLRLYSVGGCEIGMVKDVLFDYETSRVEGVEVSDGLLQDILQGRTIIPLFGKVEFGDESILVGSEALEESKSTGGGIKKILKDNDR